MHAVKSANYNFKAVLPVVYWNIFWTKATFPPPKLKFFLKNKSSLQFFFFLRMSDGADVRFFCLILIHVINLVITENSFSVLRENMYNCSVFAFCSF